VPLFSKRLEEKWHNWYSTSPFLYMFKLRELVHRIRAAQKQDAVSRRDAKADADAMATRVRDLGLTPFLCRLRPF